MGAIQRFPAGLLDLLSAKTSGWTPGEVARDLQPVVDVMALFGLATVITKTANDAAVAEGGSVVLTVPATEWWLAYAIDVMVEKTATATLGLFSLRIAQGGDPNWCSIARGGGTDWAWGSTAGDQVTACVFVPSQPWLLPPGTQLFGHVDVLGTDPTCDIGINARVAVLN